jgi:Tfp pilus assembly PilM family ATPase
MSASSPNKSGWFAPVPPTVAIEIAAGRVTVAELSGGSGGPVVSAFASESLPAGAVVPALTGSNIADAATVAEALKSALQRAGLGSPRRAALVVPDSVARVSLLNFEQMPSRASDLDQLIRWQLRKATPFPIDEAQVSHFRASGDGKAVMLAGVVARRDVIGQYEAVTNLLGIHAGVVDLASFNIMNAVISAGSAPSDDWLLVCLASDATTIAIMRGDQLMFYRHRTSVDEEPLSALVHQTAMYHEDRLGGTKFARVWLAGAALAGGNAPLARREITDRLNVPAEAVDVRPAAGLPSQVQPLPDIMDALAAPVGVLLRERRAA